MLCPKQLSVSPLTGVTVRMSNGVWYLKSEGLCLISLGLQQRNGEGSY